AVKGKDYALAEGPLTFAPGETKKSVEIEVRNSGIYDEAKTIELVLKGAKNAVLGAGTVHAYTVIDSHPRPTVAFTASEQRFKKKIGTVVIAARLSARAGRDVIVPFAVSGSAVPGGDYTITPSPLVIKAGAEQAEITITFKDGPPLEADRTIEVKLSKPGNALLGTPSNYRLVLMKDALPTIAVLPFFNTSKNKHAGEILMLQFVKELKKLTDFVVLEPGIVRQQFLNLRVVMFEGLSSSDIDLIASNINADLILTGKVADYKDSESTWGKPKVNFSVMLIERATKKVVWASQSENQGDDAITLFDWGLINTANAMVSEMVQVARKRLFTW
ncbi:MAG TPA: Calx-beta domain-containing protein, partial [Nitrospirota bacterium]|nr:Calx-beta domain-containing protein [Nitrospirota bacterium]